MNKVKVYFSIIQHIFKEAHTGKCETDFRIIRLYNLYKPTPLILSTFFKGDNI